MVTSGDKIQCPSCGKLTVVSSFCTYCGEALEWHGVKVKEDEVIIKGPSSKPAQEHVAKSESMAEDSEVSKVIDQQATVYGWRLKLVDMLINGEVSADVFTEVYRDYTQRIDVLNKKRLEELKKFEQKYSEIVSRIEQLKLRHNVGEVSDRHYVTAKLEVEKELAKIRSKILILQNPFKVKLADLPDFERSLTHRLERLEQVSEQNGIDSSLIDEVSHDFKKDLELVGSLMKDYIRIKKELEKLEVRYKVGEIREEDYIAEKQKLERELEVG